MLLLAPESFFLINSFMEMSFPYHTIHSFKVYDSVVFSMFTELCSHHQSKLRTFLFPQRLTPSPQPQASTNQLFVPMDLCIVDISHKLSYTLYDLSFSIMFSTFTHVVAEFHVFSWSNNFPVCRYTTFIHTSVNGIWLICFFNT